MFRTNQNILKGGKTRKDISCFWCSWNRRKALFETADRFGCTKVALGHHQDDIIETMLLNLFLAILLKALSKEPGEDEQPDEEGAAQDPEAQDRA